MELKSIEFFVKKFSRLNTATVRGNKAPHKPILLISIIQSIEVGEILKNKIFITADLVARFKDNWHRLVRDEGFTENFSLPFYHLHSEGFWFLRLCQGQKLL
jgi:putative restriction endonuclease